ncbi:hypothetical protein L209DRAFT_756141 [Thermothelomyces heterothallicus CBS 203.75]
MSAAGSGTTASRVGLPPLSARFGLQSLPPTVLGERCRTTGKRKLTRARSMRLPMSCW